MAARPSQFVRLMGRDSLFGNAHGLAGQILSRVGAFPIKRDSDVYKRQGHVSRVAVAWSRVDGVLLGLLKGQGQLLGGFAAGDA